MIKNIAGFNCRYNSNSIVLKVADWHHWLTALWVVSPRFALYKPLSPLSLSFSLFCGGFTFFWLSLRDDSSWHFSKNYLFFFSFNRFVSFSYTMFLFRASVLWLLPSCISFSWRPSAGCWQRHGSPTWPSSAKWDRGLFASAFCASAGVSNHKQQHLTLQYTR